MKQLTLIPGKPVGATNRGGRCSLRRSCLPRLLLGWLLLGCSLLTARAATDSFSGLFPGFIQACSDLHDSMIPFALVVLVLSFAYLGWHHRADFIDIITHLTKVFLIVLLIQHSGTLINHTQAMLEQWLAETIPARPEAVAERYQEKLAEAQQAPQRDDRGFFGRIFDASIFESLVAAVLILITWGGMAVVWFVFLVQKIILFLCWALSPPIFALFCVPPLTGIAWRHLLRLAGVLGWPVGIALAGTISEGLLEGMVRDSFLKDLGFFGAVGYGLNNLLALALLALWLIASSLIFPLVVSRMIGAGAGAVTVLTRSGDLTANVGLPALARLGAVTWGYLRTRFGGGSQSTSTRNPEPVPSMSPDTSEPPPASVTLESDEQPRPDDPTGARRVEETLDEMNLKS